MSVMFVEPVLEGRPEWTVRIVESGEFVRCTPTARIGLDRNVVGWIGTNLVLVDKEDIADLSGVLEIIAIETWRPKLIQGGRSDADAISKFAPTTPAAMDA